MVSLRAINLVKLNSLSKYPSIPTYHRLDSQNGILLDDCVPFVSEVIGTEKVDGTNARIILLPDDNYVLGSREELLYARGDLIGNPALGIVSALKEVAESLCQSSRSDIRIYYVEVYGGKVTAASKQYTQSRQVSFRLFDIAAISNYAELLEWPVEKFSTWREIDTSRFLSEDALREQAALIGLTLTPRLFFSNVMPKGIEETYEALKNWIPQTLCALDSGAGGKAEGVVVRTNDRSVIAKIRFEDYERTIKRRKKN